MRSLRLTLLSLAICGVTQAADASEIVRCKAANGSVTYQAAPCPDRTEESNPRIAAAYPAPNVVESQRIFEREAALDRRLEARRDREMKEHQMREARAEREAERERLALLAAQQQQQYVVVYPPWGVHPARRAPHPVLRHSGQRILR